jgi:hypothetical protein
MKLTSYESHWGYLTDDEKLAAARFRADNPLPSLASYLCPRDINQTVLPHISAVLGGLPLLATEAFVWGTRPVNLSLGFLMAGIAYIVPYVGVNALKREIDRSKIHSKKSSFLRSEGIK